MCGTRMPPEERPPDGTILDTLIGDNGLGDYGPRSRFHFQRERRRRPAGAAGSMAAAAEAALCGLSERGGDAGSVTTRGGGGGVGGGNNDSGSAISDAAAGSAIGALGAGVLSAMTPGTRPGRVLASMMQGALVGGVAGAALGTGFRFDSREGGGGGGGGDNGNTAVNGRDGRDGLSRFGGPAGRRGHVPIGLRDPERQLVVARDLERMLLRQHMREMGLSNEVAEDMLENMGGEVLGEGQERPASAAAIAALPQETLGEGSLSRMAGDDEGARQCCICLDNLGAGDVMTRLPCLHLYHAACIKRWLHTSGTCPQCKHRVD
ncbi:unnamed protein product [Laminaria digitata]